MDYEMVAPKELSSKFKSETDLYRVLIYDSKIRMQLPLLVHLFLPSYKQ